MGTCSMHMDSFDLAMSKSFGDHLVYFSLNCCKDHTQLMEKQTYENLGPWVTMQHAYWYF